MKNMSEMACFFSLIEISKKYIKNHMSKVVEKFPKFDKGKNRKKKNKRSSIG